MERLKGSIDDLRNKIRPGTAWVSGFTQPGNNDDLRAIDSDGAEMHVIPESRYYASTTIRRGQAVSIAQLEDLSKERRQDKYAYVKVTDPDVDETCLGIAMNYAEPGQIVQIQSRGKFNYCTTKSVLCTPTALKKEIFLDSDGWSFDSVRGQRLYVKKLYDNRTEVGTNEDGSVLRPESKVIPTDESGFVDENGDAFDTGHKDNEQTADVDGWFTYDFVNSAYNAKNTIQIGYLTDAPSQDENSKYVSFTQLRDGDGFVWTDSRGDKKVAVIVEQVKVSETEYKVLVAEKTTIVDLNGSTITFEKGDVPPKANEAVWLQKIGEDLYGPVDDQIVTIELNITGDTRGPIDNTQFFVTLGETIYFETGKKDVDLTEPHYNEGIFDELKVLALSQGIKSGPLFRIFNRVQTNYKDTKLEKCFISLRKLDGDTYIIPVLCSLNKEALENSLTSVNDEGYFKLTQQFMSQSEREYCKEVDGKLNYYKRSPKLTIAEPLEVLDRDHLIEAVTKGLQTIFVDDETGREGCEPVVSIIGDDGFSITTKEFGGYYDFYVSSELLSYISVTTACHGKATDAGTAVLADIRDADRLNILGVVTSNQSGVRRKGETVKVVKMGKIITHGNVQPGLQYYIGLNGRLTGRSQYWYDHCVPIAVAESTNCLIVDISPVPMHSYSGNFQLGYMKPSVFGKPEKGFALMDGITPYSKEANKELYELLLNWFDEEELKPSNVTEEQVKHTLESEYYDIFSDIYGNINKFTSGLQVTQNDLKKHEEDAAERFNKINQRLQTIQDVNDLQTSRLDAIENLNNEQSALIASIQAVNEDQDKAISELDERLTKLISDTEVKLTKALDDYKAVVAAAQKVQDDNIAELQSGLASLQTDVDEKFETVNKTITDGLAKQLQTVKELIKESEELITTKFTAEDSRIEQTLTTKVNELKGALTSLTAEHDQTKAQVSELQKSLIEQIELLDSLYKVTETADGDKVTTGLIADDIQELRQSIEAVSASLSQSIAAINSQINSVSGKLSDLQIDYNELIGKHALLRTEFDSQVSATTKALNEIRSTLYGGEGLSEDKATANSTYMLALTTSALVLTFFKDVTNSDAITKKYKDLLQENADLKEQLSDYSQQVEEKTNELNELVNKLSLDNLKLRAHVAVVDARQNESLGSIASLTTSFSGFKDGSNGYIIAEQGEYTFKDWLTNESLGIPKDSDRWTLPAELSDVDNNEVLRSLVFTVGTNSYSYLDMLNLVNNTELNVSKLNADLKCTVKIIKEGITDSQDISYGYWTYGELLSLAGVDAGSVDSITLNGEPITQSVVRIDMPNVELTIILKKEEPVDPDPSEDPNADLSD